jgi:outer membrane protein OmpA-like peptidoglycan-associated protein
MIGKRFSHCYYPVLALAAFLYGCSAGQGGDFVKHVDSGATNYTVSPSAPEFHAAGQTREIIYLKKGEREPIRLSPYPSSTRADKSGKEVLTPVQAGFKAADTPEKLAAFIEENAPDELAFVAVQRLAQPALQAKKWDEAKSIFATYRERFPNKATAFNAITSLLEAPETGLAVNNLGPNINTGEGEYAPVISADGKKMLFARDCGVCDGGEEVYSSRLDQSGYWLQATPFGPPLTTRGHEVPLALSADGNTLAVYGNYAQSLGRGDIFHLNKTREGWTGLNHYPAPLNSEYFDSNAMYTADGKAMLFISERPGGVGDLHEKGKYFHGGYDGNTDIYVYLPNSEGGGEVINLGSVINTPYAEYSPFLHPDGKTLYFSSDGHPGLGGLDVFKATRLNSDSWTEWSQPVNLGKEINTPDNDWGYQFPASGDKAYFAVSNRSDGFGGSDIYSIGLPPAVKPGTVITIYGTVTDPEGTFLSADIRWNDLDAGKEVGEATSDPQNGEFVIILPGGGRYAYFAEKPGYMGESEHVDLTEDLGYREYALDIVLYPIPQAPEVVVEEPEPPVLVPVEPEVVAVIRMNNIFFDFDKATLRSESRLELDRWVRMLNENPAISLEIAGHTDSIGTEAYNQKLSERRAQSVRDYLIAQGIDQGRLVAMGFGELQPVAANDTEEGRQRNRRVEVKILNNGNGRMK